MSGAENRNTPEENRLAVDRYFSAMYDELRRSARRALALDPRATINPTALVNEAFLKMLNVPDFEWMEPGRKKGIAVRAMRQALVDLARKAHAIKRSGDIEPLVEEPAALSLSPETALAIDAAIEKITLLNPRHAKIMELRCFGGFEMAEIAEELGLAKPTVERDWRALRAWLRSEIGLRN